MQNQALNALSFLYKVVLERPLDKSIAFTRAKKKLPVILTRDEIHSLFPELNSHYWLTACLMYDSGLRLMECLRLRVMHLDFEHRTIRVINGKGGKDLVVTLADELETLLRRHLQQVPNIHDKNVADGYGEFYLPHALARKYPNAAGLLWAWQYVFPATQRSEDPRSGVIRRHQDEQALQRAIKTALRRTDIEKPASSQLRHSFATHL